VLHPKGSPENPIDEAQIRLKFDDCARRARRPLPDADIDLLGATILGLDRVAKPATILARSTGSALK
jgi:hypothetical protein